MSYQRTFAELADTRDPLESYPRPTPDVRVTSAGYFGRDADGRRVWKLRLPAVAPVRRVRRDR